MKYEYAINHCSTCGKLTKWQRQCPRGKWYCMKCKAESEIHCNHTDAEIAKSFIEDVEAVKDLLSQERSGEK